MSPYVRGPVIPMEAPLREVESALDRGFRPVDVRSDATGVTVELERGSDRRTVRISPEQARSIVAADRTPTPRTP